MVKLTGDFLDQLVEKHLGIRMKMANKYMVKVPAVATMSEEELELKGPPIVYKNGKPLQGSENRLIAVTLPIWRILEIYENGYPIVLVRRSDLKRFIKDLERIVLELEQNPLVSYKEYIERLNAFIEEIMENNSLTIKRVLNERDEKMVKYGLGGTGFFSTMDKADVVMVNKEHKKKGPIDLSGVEVYDVRR